VRSEELGLRDERAISVAPEKGGTPKEDGAEATFGEVELTASYPYRQLRRRRFKVERGAWQIFRVQAKVRNALSPQGGNNEVASQIVATSEDQRLGLVGHGSLLTLLIFARLDVALFRSRK
jgi:hypothetical protein